MSEIPPLDMLWDLYEESQWPRPPRVKGSGYLVVVGLFTAVFGAVGQLFWGPLVLLFFVGIVIELLGCWLQHKCDLRQQIWRKPGELLKEHLDQAWWQMPFWLTHRVGDTPKELLSAWECYTGHMPGDCPLCGAE